MKRVLLLALCLMLTLTGAAARADDKAPLIVAVSAEYGVKGSHAAQSIEKGMRVAIEEINAAGGVLGGRRLAIETRDDRGVPARAIDNFRELAEKPDVVAVFCGRFSPVALEVAPFANRLGLLYLDPWAAADGITHHPSPNFVFRLALTDTWAIEAMLGHARLRGFKRMALFVPNNAWGRSSQAAALSYIKRHAGLRLDTHWYNWGDTEFTERIAAAHHAGAQAIAMVANEAEGAYLVRQMAELPAARRLPLISHWGIAAGDFAGAAGPALSQVDLVVVQTYTFHGAKGERVRAVDSVFRGQYGVPLTSLHAQVGFAHAYDLTHLLARAINRAGTADRKAIRDALESTALYDGLVRRYVKPFSADDHEALDPSQLFMARYAADGSLRAEGGKKR